MIFDTLFKEFQKGKISPALIISKDNLYQEALSFSKKILRSSSYNPHHFPDHLIDAQLEAMSYPNFFLCRAQSDEKMTPEITMDQIQLTLHFLRTTPAIPGWRVLIIDDADKMNRFAFNALLKSIEEPPTQVCVLLLTSHLAKIPMTLRSRLQKWFYRTPYLEEEALYANGSKERLMMLKEVGGLSFVQEVKSYFKKSMHELNPFVQKIIKDKKALDVFTWLFPNILYRCCIDTKDQTWLNAWEKANEFWKEALHVHLDKGHFVMAAFLIVNKALEHKT